MKPEKSAEEWAIEMSKRMAEHAPYLPITTEHRIYKDFALKIQRNAKHAAMLEAAQNCSGWVLAEDAKKFILTAAKKYED